MVFHFFGLFKEGSFGFSGGGVRTVSQPVMLAVFVSVDLASRWLIKSKFIKKFGQEIRYPILAETVNYLLVFSALSFLLCLVFVSVFIIASGLAYG